VTDVFLPSIDELAFMLNPPPGDKLSLLRSMAEKLLELGAGVVGIKIGSDGIYLRTSGDAGRLAFLEHSSWLNREFISPCRKVKVVGATGAGDSAIAGFLAGIAAGLSADDTARLAMGAGSCNVTAHDAISGIIPMREIQEKLKSGWKACPLSFVAEHIEIVS
jgi:sugar/nucleoside kinase (ribokinase family)